MEKYVYVVGQITGDTWELGGVYNNLLDALCNCFDEDDFIGLTEFNAPATKEPKQYLASCYPKSKNGELTADFNDFLRKVREIKRIN